MGFGKYRDGMSSMLVSRLLIVGACEVILLLKYSVIENRNSFVVVGFFLILGPYIC